MEHNAANSSGHLTEVRRQFARQARRFGDPQLTVAQTELLDWMRDFLPLTPDSRVLDVAAGTGHLSRAVAPRVKHVTAVDLTGEMLHELARETGARNIGNLAYARGLAESLPIRDQAFDLVVSRLAFHHFEQPLSVLREMTRTCKPDGAIAIIDLVSPSDPARADAYNRCERQRDPSHVRALTEAEIALLLRDAGLSIVGSIGRDIMVNVESWLALAETPPPIANQLRQELRADLAGGDKTGMRPFIRDGELMFFQRWQIAIARPR